MTVSIEIVGAAADALVVISTGKRSGLGGIEGLMKAACRLEVKSLIIFLIIARDYVQRFSVAMCQPVVVEGATVGAAAAVIVWAVVAVGEAVEV